MQNPLRLSLTASCTPPLRRVSSNRSNPFYSDRREDSPMSELRQEVQTASREEILLRFMQIGGLEGHCEPVFLLRHAGGLD